MAKTTGIELTADALRLARLFMDLGRDDRDELLQMAESLEATLKSRKRAALEFDELMHRLQTA